MQPLSLLHSEWPHNPAELQIRYITLETLITFTHIKTATNTMAKRLDCCVLVWSTLAKKGSWVVGPNWIQLPLTSLALSFPVEERERESLVYTIFLGKYYPSHMFQHQSFMADHKEHNFFTCILLIVLSLAVRRCNLNASIGKWGTLHCWWTVNDAAGRQWMMTYCPLLQKE